MGHRGEEMKASDYCFARFLDGDEPAQYLFLGKAYWEAHHSLKIEEYLPRSFRDLLPVGLYSASENTYEYQGDGSEEELVNQLKEMGFTQLDDVNLEDEEDF